MKELLYVVIPAYNEEANIKDVVSQWDEAIGKITDDYVIMVANDGSRDNTLKVLQELQVDMSHLQIVDKPNSGHGATLLTLYKKAIEQGAKYIFQTDSDGQTLPEEFDAFWKERESYDFIIGTRYGRQDGISRIIVTKTLRAVVRLCFGVKVPDANTPYRLMETKKLKAIIDRMPDDYNLTNVVISAVGCKWGYDIKWIPITFRPRQGGVNSINLRRITKIGVHAIKDFININRIYK